jgi:mRNA interferase RelE/StbE
MSWNVVFMDKAKRDLENLEISTKSQIAKSITKVSQNPLPRSEGGYGEPLGNKGGINLTGCLKIKFKKLGIRVVYKLARTEQEMKIIIISARADNEVYTEAKKTVR